MRLYNRFAILHLLSVMLWNFVQDFSNLNFFRKKGVVYQFLNLV